MDPFDRAEGYPFPAPERGRRPEEDVAHRQALRLTFEYRGAKVRLILLEAIEMIVPPSLDITSQPPGAEFWYELQDSKQKPLYRRVQRKPLGPLVEIHTGNPERPFAHLDSGRTEGEFTLLVPNLPQARSIALYEWSPPPDADHRPSPAEIARFPVGRAIDKEAIARDTIPPRTVSDALAFYDGAAVIKLRASDNTGEVASTFYRLGDGNEQQGLTVTIGEPGEYTLLFWSVDRAGNVEPENRVTFTIRPPTKRGKQPT